MSWRPSQIQHRRLITGTTTALETLLPAKSVVADQTWFFADRIPRISANGAAAKLTFSDDAQTYNLVFSPMSRRRLSTIATWCRRSDFKSWKDLLDPKWHGKIALKDPLSAGGGLGNSTLWYSRRKSGQGFHPQTLNAERSGDAERRPADARLRRARKVSHCDRSKRRIDQRVHCARVAAKASAARQF